MLGEAVKMIKCELRTNLDSCRIAVGSSFPSEFLAVPRVGEWIRATKPVYIRSNDGERKIPALELKVVSVVYGENAESWCKGPYIEIELNHPYAREMGLL